MLKINVGLSRKVGEANYGSRGATVHLEMEVDGGVVRQPDELKKKLRYLFGLAKEAVDDELKGPSGSPPSHNGTGNHNGGYGGDGGNGRRNGNGRPATASQARAIRAIAGRRRFDLGQLLGERFGVSRPEELSLGDASSLIDELKAPTNGNGGER